MKKRTIDIIIYLFFTIFAGILSLYLGMDRNKDVLNYHIYNPFALIENRLTTDIMPAGIQSYFNPLLDIPYYLCIKYINNHPAIVTFIFGFSYALLLFLIYKLSLLIFKNYNKYILAAISVLIGSGAFYVIRGIGGLTHDIFVADLILISLYILLKELENKFNYKNILVAGFFIGSAVGFKYTAAVFSIPLIITFLVFYKNFQKPFKSLLVLSLGSLIGFLLFDGFLLYKLYSTFDNPLFPYFNNIFHSDLLNAQNVYNTDFSKDRPQDIFSIIFYPFVKIRDARFATIWIIFFINLFTIPFVDKEKFKTYFPINIIYTDFILTFSFFVYIFWINSFGVIRYISPFFAYTGILSIAVCMKLYYIFHNILQKLPINSDIFLKSIIKNIYVIVVSIILIIIFAPQYKIGKSRELVRVPVENKLVYVEDLKIPDNAIVLLNQGLGILIPFQNKKAKYIHINGTAYTKQGITVLSTNIINDIKNMLQSNSDKIYVLLSINKDIIPIINKEEVEQKINNKENITHEEAIAFELDKFNINRNTMQCKIIESNIKDTINTKENPVFYFCKAEIK